MHKLQTLLILITVLTIVVSIPLPIIMPHFHKAGGTSMCVMFAAARYKVHSKHMNCNCPDVSLQRLLDEKRSINEEIAGDSGRNVCFFERGLSWPEPVYFHRLLNNFTGGLVTIMRDPWSRFKSNYEKDYSKCGRHCPFQSIEEFAQMEFFETYGGTLYSRPNFYVRMLNGLAGKNPQKVLHDKHLAAAKSILSKFHAIIFLEQDPEQRREVIRYICSGLSMDLPTMTNNVLSNFSHSHKAISESKIPPDTSHYEAKFREENKMDIQLYDWAYSYFTSYTYMEQVRLRMATERESI